MKKHFSLYITKDFNYDRNKNLQLKQTKKETKLIKFRKVVPEVSFIVGNPEVNDKEANTCKELLRGGVGGGG